MFIKNIIKLASGTAISQLLPLLVLPIVASCLGSSDFGLYSIFFTTTIMFGTISSFRFDYAINCAESLAEAKKVYQLCLIVNLFFSLLFIPIIFIIFILDVVTWEWFLLPLSVFFMSMYQSYYALLNYTDSYGFMGVSRLTNQGVCAVVQLLLIYGFDIKEGAYIGLFLGYLVAYIFCRMLFRGTFSKFNLDTLLVTFKKYIRYPKLILPGTLINFISGNLTLYTLTFLFGPSSAGYYSLAVRIAGAPTGVIAKSIGDVFRSQALAELKNRGGFESSFNYIFFLSSILAVLGFSILYFISDFLFTTLFGKEWIQSSEYVQMLLPMLIFQFISATIAYSLMLKCWEHVELYWQVFRTVLLLLTVLVAYYVYGSATAIVFASSISLSISFFVYIYIAYSASRQNNDN